MSATALFGDDSSDDEEFEPTDKAEEAPKKDALDSDGGSDDKEPTESNKPETGDSNDDKDEAEKETQPKPTTADLFGDDSDDDDEGDAKFDDVVGSAAPAQSKLKKEPTSNMDSTQPGASGDTDLGGTKTSKPPQLATVMESSHPSKDVSLHMTKLPNLVAIQPSAFEEDSYLEKEEEEEYKGYVHNMIRWRYKRGTDGKNVRDNSGKLIRESNSRLVKWSDGSFTLHIGNEAFDIQSTDAATTGFAGLNGYMYLSQKATYSNEGDEDEAPGGTVLECLGPVSSRLVAKPSSLQSEAHKSLTVAVRQRTIKKARIAEYVTQEDPERAKQARIRNKEDLEKANARKTSSYRPSGGPRHRMPGMNRRYLEEDDEDGDYDTTNIRALKKGSAMDDDMDDYGDESDDDGYDGTFRSRARKGRKKEEEEDEEELVFGEESDEDEGTLIKAHTKKRSHQAVVDDDDE